MDPLADLLGQSPAIAELRKQVRGLLQRQSGSRRAAPILVQGETGTGKGLLARVIHQAGSRRNGPFVDLNCAAIPETLLEAELFGHERGAFTDARHSRPGLFQAASGGTLFLDEIGLLPATLQAKILTAIEQRAVRRLGASRPEPVDVAIIAATNDDLVASVREGRFREDLYHRLAVLTLRLPPLRERPEDVDLLADHVLARISAEYGLPPWTLTSDARAALHSYRWPGNVRELGNVLERAALMASGRTIDASGLDLAGASAAAPHTNEPEAPVGETARQRLREALDATGWNITRTAARLGITRNTVRAWMQRYGLRPGPSAGAPPSAPPPEEESPGAVVDTGIRWTPRPVAFLRAQLHGDPGAAARARTVERAAEKIRTFGGRVEEIGQSQILAVFGHEPAEDAPRRAANAATVLAKTLAHPPVALALDARRVLVASVGGRVQIDHDDKRGALQALDDLEPLAPGEVAVGDEAAPLLERDFEVKPRAPGAKGSRLVGRLSRPAGPAIFVGRRRELDALTDLLDQARQGRGQVVTLIGEPGIGKSRLVRELLDALDDATAVLTGACAAYTATVPYAPITAMLQRAFSIGDGDGREKIAARVEAALASVGPHLAASAPYLASLFDPDSAAGPAGASPEVTKARTFDAVQQLVLAQQERRPVLVIVEDLHWIDRTSEELLAGLAALVPRARVLVLGTCRPGYQPPWGGSSHATQLALGPLSPRDSRRLLEALLPTRPDDEPLVQALIERAEGNPFFLEELARGVGGRAAAAAGVPATIQSVIGARIDALPEDERQLLQVAAVIGRDVPLALLARASGQPPESMRARLGRLQAGEYLHAARLGPEAEVVFKHALTHEVAYASLLEDERAALHGRVADALVALAPDTVERRPDVLARHCAAAGRTREAVEHWRRAGELAVRRSANTEAIAHLTRALDLLPALDEGARLREEIHLCVALAAAQVAREGFGSAELAITLDRLRALAARAGQTPELTPVRYGVWRFALARADFDAAEQVAAELLATARQHPEPAIRVAAEGAAGMTALYLGDLPRACRHFEVVADWPLPVGERGTQLYGQDLGAGILGYHAWALALAGALDRGAALAEQALAEAREGGHLFTVAHALNTAGLVHCERREPEAVSRLAREMVELSSAHGFRFLAALATMLDGWARFALGDRDGGLQLMREGSVRYAGAHQRVGLRHRAQLAEALAGTGAFDEALQLTGQALEHAEATRDGLYLPEVLRVRGEALILGREEISDGVACLRRATELASTQGAHLLALRAVCSRVRLGPAADRADALAAVAAALTRIAEGLELPDLRAARALLEGGAP